MSIKMQVGPATWCKLQQGEKIPLASSNKTACWLAENLPQEVTLVQIGDFSEEVNILVTECTEETSVISPTEKTAPLKKRENPTRRVRKCRMFEKRFLFGYVETDRRKVLPKSVEKMRTFILSKLEFGKPVNLRDIWEGCLSDKDEHLISLLYEEMEAARESYRQDQDVDTYGMIAGAQRRKLKEFQTRGECRAEEVFTSLVKDGIVTKTKDGYLPRTVNEATEEKPEEELEEKSFRMHDELSTKVLAICKAGTYPFSAIKIACASEEEKEELRRLRMSGVSSASLKSLETKLDNITKEVIKEMVESGEIIKDGDNYNILSNKKGEKQ